MSTGNVNKKIATWTDPSGKFSLVIPWKIYQAKKHKAQSQPYQFPIAGKSYFQISCRAINEKISSLIKANNLVQYNPSMPDISFFEGFQTEFGGPDLSTYIWMCPVG